jgi:anion-transporting  ArsA/GET3 family ATPase
VNEPLERLLARTLVIVTGKGGVGKSTVAAALGLAGARRRRRTLIVEVAAQDRLSRVFRTSGVGYEPAPIAPNLWAMSIDPQTALEEYLELQLPSRRLAAMVSHSRIFGSLAAATPGMREVVTLGKVWYTVNEGRDDGAPRWDLVIVDAPATGHGVAFLQSARTFAEVAKVGPVANQSRTIDAMLTDGESTAVCLVAMPEEMPVNEAAEMHGVLEEDLGVAVGALVVNGCYPRRFDDAELARLVEHDDGEGPIRAAAAMERRARLHAEQVARLESATGEVAIRLPFLFRRALDLTAMRQLATALESRVALRSAG